MLFVDGVFNFLSILIATPKKILVSKSDSFRFILLVLFSSVDKLVSVLVFASLFFAVRVFQREGDVVYSYELIGVLAFLIAASFFFFLNHYFSVSSSKQLTENLKINKEFLTFAVGLFSNLSVYLSIVIFHLFYFSFQEPLILASLCGITIYSILSFLWRYLSGSFRPAIKIAKALLIILCLTIMLTDSSFRSADDVLMSIGSYFICFRFGALYLIEAFYCAQKLK